MIVQKERVISETTFLGLAEYGVLRWMRASDARPIPSSLDAHESAGPTIVARPKTQYLALRKNFICPILVRYVDTRSKSDIKSFEDL